MTNASGYESDDSGMSEGRDLACGVPEKQEYWLAPSVRFADIALTQSAPIGQVYNRGMHSRLRLIVFIKGQSATAAGPIPCSFIRSGAVVYIEEGSTTLGDVNGASENELRGGFIRRHTSRMLSIIQEPTWRS